jgi:hypothetical protein
MTLRDKFQKQQVVTYSNNHTLTRSSAELLIEIADEFAIEFVDWVLINPNINQFQYSYKDLLETFKKEKGYVDKDN